MQKNQQPQVADQIAKLAMQEAMEFEQLAGRNPADVSGRPEFAGIDIVSVKRDGSEARTIEVKGTTNESDLTLHETQVNASNMKIVASHLYVCLLPKEGKGKGRRKQCRLILISRENIKPSDFKEGKYYKLSWDAVRRNKRSESISLFNVR